MKLLWLITYKYSKFDRDNYFYVTAPTERGALGMFKHIRGEVYSASAKLD